jgi:hypothetical protein
LLLAHGAKFEDLRVPIHILRQIEDSGKTPTDTGTEPYVDVTLLQQLEDIVLTPDPPDLQLQACREAEHAGNYKLALKHLAAYESKLWRETGKPPLWLENNKLAQNERKPLCTRALWDEKRLRESIYGFQYCGRRMSYWKPHFFEKPDLHPSSDVF